MAVSYYLPRQHVETEKEKRRKATYNKPEWKRLRKAKLQANPLCEVCLVQGRYTPAEAVHHKDSFLNYSGQASTLKALDYDNLISLCAHHHNRLHSILEASNQTSTTGQSAEEIVKIIDEWDKRNKVPQGFSKKYLF